MSGEHREQPVTFGRTFGLGRSLPTPREHCKRCTEITARADQMVSNYVIANGRQVDIINRLLENPDHTKEVVRLGQLLAEHEAFIDYLFNEARSDTDEGHDLRTRIEEFRSEVSDAEGPDAGAAG